MEKGAKRMWGTFSMFLVTEKKIYRKSKQKLVKIKAILDKAKILFCLMHC